MPAIVRQWCFWRNGELDATNEMSAEKEKQTFFAQQERLWRTRCHAEGMVKSEESKVYAKREPLWRILRHERSECGEGEVGVSA